MNRPVDDALRAALPPELEPIRLLGAGATAEVILAREPALQRLVAVKMLRAELAADAVARQRFEREAQSAARIRHPNVTAIHSVGRTADGRPFIVMEYVEGRTVADLLSAAAAPLDEARGLEILRSVAAALGAAHERGIIHRDVRPGNVLVEHRTGRAVLGDFGIAALLETGSAAATRLTVAGMTLGDVRYQSPEQIRGERAVEQSDIYAFGVLAYELLTGRGPYEASSPAELLAAHLQKKPADLRSRRPQLALPIVSVLTRCLAKEPNQRPLARDIVLELDAADRAGPAAGRQGSLADLFTELRRRNVYQVLAAYTAVALAILGVAQVVYEAFELSRTSYRLLVGSLLAGLPLSLVLAWVYDIRAGRIQRTPGEPGARTRLLLWAALGASLLVAGVAGWLLLR
ncbi:MAG TPA: serine/threonine-protein kinase [Longimicrobiales bacterium]